MNRPEERGEIIVPLTLKIDTAKRILLIFGSQCGRQIGLSENVGLLQYMFQCGLLIPASQTSNLSILNRFSGHRDEQSLENDLSTYIHGCEREEILNRADDKP